MAVKMNDFLLEYFKRMIFRSMSIEQFVHYCDFVKADDMAGNMEEWRDTLLEKNAAGELVTDAAGLYVRKDYPDPFAGDFELEPAEWEKMFRAFNNAFQEMDAYKNSFKYEKKPTDFLNKYFGSTGQLFSYTTASIAAETKIAELKNILETHASQLRPKLTGFFNDDFTWDDLITGIADKKYNKNPSFREKMTSIAEALAADTQVTATSAVYSVVGRKLDFSAIRDGFEGGPINPAKMMQFQLSYRDLLRELYTNTKAFEYFSAHDPTKISKLLNEAKGRLDYNDTNSKGYISPKRPDSLTLPQRISEWWDKTYSNYLEKYVKLTPDRMFISLQAKAIFQEIDKLHLNPADGLDKVLENTDKISGKLKAKYKKAADHFEWFTKTLTELKNTMGKGKAFEKALSNGHSMNMLVQQIIIKAVNENKIDEAKTTLEILPVLRYAYTTSRIMDVFNKSDLTIFSVISYSWNTKNPAMQFITNAMDLGIKKAFQLAGYGITMAGNAINRIGTKFNGKMGKNLRDARNAKMDEWSQQRSDLESNVSRYETERSTKSAELRNLIRAGNSPIQLKRDISGYERRRDLALQSFNQRLEKLTQIWGVMTYTPGVNRADIDILGDIISRLRDDVNADIDPAQISAITDVNIQREINRMLARRNNFIQNANDLRDSQTKYQELVNAKNAVKAYDELIDKANEDLANWDSNHKDKYAELMAYWDLCNSGFNKSWFGNRDAQQKKFTKNMVPLVQARLDAYRVA